MLQQLANSLYHATLRVSGVYRPFCKRPTPSQGEDHLEKVAQHEYNCI